MPIPPPFLKGQLVEGEALSAVARTDRRLLNLTLPPWQRAECWTEDKKRSFVEGIFLGFGCGYYVKNSPDWGSDGNPLPMSGWLLDGQQRISAIRDFLGGALVVFGDVTFPSMSVVEQRRFMRSPFPCFDIDYMSDESVLKSLYDRLNFGGVAHMKDQWACAPG